MRTSCCTKFAVSWRLRVSSCIGAVRCTGSLTVADLLALGLCRIMFGSIAKICNSGLGYEASVSRAGGLAPVGAIVALIGTPRSSSTLPPGTGSGIGPGVFLVRIGGLHVCQSTPESSVGSHDSRLSSSGVPTGFLSFPVRVLGCIRSQTTVSTGNLGGKYCPSSLSVMKHGRNKHLASISEEGILEFGALLSYIWLKLRSL